MENVIKQRISVKPVTAFRRSKNNPYMYGLQMKRKLTVREACHIYRNILLFNIDLAIDDIKCDSFVKEELHNFYDEITNAMNSYIAGDIGWMGLCDATYCYDTDEDDGLSVAAALKLVEYLQSKGVI
jgi:hypothetical protein